MTSSARSGEQVTSAALGNNLESIGAEHALLVSRMHKQLAIDVIRGLLVTQTAVSEKMIASGKRSTQAFA